MEKELLEVLCCPATRQPLRMASPAELALANARLAEPITEGLLREDGGVLYPIRNGIPLLVPAEGLTLT